MNKLNSLLSLIVFLTIFLCNQSYSATRYWVGGAGTWNSSSTTNWASSSGGASGASAPTSSDDVIFDASSGLTGATVTTGSGAVCNAFTWSATVGTLSISATTTMSSNFTWSGAGGTLSGSSDLNIAGNITLHASMTLTYSGDLAMTATSGTKTLTTAGKTITFDMEFNGSGGTFSMQDNYSSATGFSVYAGTLTTNNYTITCKYFAATGSGTKTINLGSSSMTITDSFGIWGVIDLSGTNLTFNAGNIVTLLAGATLAVNGTLTAAGNCQSQYIYLKSSSGGTAATLSSTGAQAMSNIIVYDVTAATSTFTCTNCVDKATTDGTWSWASARTARTLYWSSNAGSYSDYTKWYTATNGGGSQATCSPNPLDALIFDANSFSSNVNLTLDKMYSYANSITWSALDQVVTLYTSGSTDKTIVAFSDVTAKSTMLATSSYIHLDLESSTNPTLIDEQAIAFTNISFGNTGTYRLASTLNADGDITINTGATLDVLPNGGVAGTDEKNITCGGDWTNNGTFNERANSSVSVTFDGSTYGYIQTAETFYNLICNKGSSYDVTMFDDVTVSNNFTSNAGIFDVFIYTLTVAGTSDINAEVDVSSGTFDANGTFDATGGTFTFSSSGNLYLSAATVTSLGTFTCSTSTVTYDYAGAQNVPAATYYNLVTSSSGTKTAQGTVNVGNNLTLNGTTTYAVGTTTTTVTGTSDINTTLTVSTGTFDANGTFDATGGSVTFTGAGNLYLGSTVTSIGTFTESTSTVTYDGTAQSVRSDTYYNLTLAGSGNKTPSGTVTVSNNFTENGTATYVIGTTTTNVTGATDINSTVTISTGTLDTDGSFDATGGTITFSGAGNLYLSGATITSLGTFTESTSTVTYDYAGAQNVIADTYYNLVIATSGTKSAQGTVNVSNNFTINNTATYAVGTTTTTVTGTSDVNSILTISTGTFDADGTFDATGGTVTFTGAGNLYFSGATVTSIGTFTPSTGSVYYDRAGAQTILSTTYNNLYIATSGTKTLGGAIITNGNLQISAGTLDVSGSNYGITCGGNWTNNGTFTAQSGTVTLNGSSAQTLGGSSTTTFYNYTNNNSSTGVSLGVNTTVTNTLTLTAGLLKTVSYTLTIGTTSTNGSVSGGSSSTYIVAYDNGGTIGYLKQFVNSNTSYSYPIGDATNYTPLTFTLTSNAALASAYYTVYTKPIKIPGLNSAFGTYLTRFWEGTSSGMTTPVYSLSYTYVNGDIVGTEANLLPVKKSGTTWYKPTGSSFTSSTAQGTGSVNTGTNTLTWTSLTTFSYNGGAGDAATALPIELTSFTGENDGTSNIIKWETESERNSDYFTVEKTLDGNDYQIVGTVNGAGNSNVSNNYELYDNQVEKTINYYRLKQVDFDGLYNFSKEISIDNREKNTTDKSIVSITNILGQEVSENYRGLIIISYSDGSSMKTIR